MHFAICKIYVYAKFKIPSLPMCDTQCTVAATMWDNKVRFGKKDQRSSTICWPTCNSDPHLWNPEPTPNNAPISINTLFFENPFPEQYEADSESTNDKTNDYIICIIKVMIIIIIMVPVIVMIVMMMHTWEILQQLVVLPRGGLAIIAAEQCKTVYKVVQANVQRSIGPL